MNLHKTGLDFDYQNPEKYSDIPKKEDVIHWIALACPRETPYSVSVRVVAEPEARSLNLQYRNKDYPTNVLTFPFEPPPIPMETLHLGDLVVCKQVIEKESQLQNKATPHHWAHMIIHGILHLQGYDHISKTQAKQMESLEISLLKELGIKNPYAYNG